MLRPLGMHRRAIQHARLAHGKVCHIDHFLNFAVPLCFDLADFERHQCAEQIFMLPQRCAEQPDKLSPLGSRNKPPLLKCRHGFPHDMLIVIG